MYSYSLRKFGSKDWLVKVPAQAFKLLLALWFFDHSLKPFIETEHHCQ